MVLTPLVIIFLTLISVIALITLRTCTLHPTTLPIYIDVGRGQAYVGSSRGQMRVVPAR